MSDRIENIDSLVALVDELVMDIRDRGAVEDKVAFDRTYYKMLLPVACDAGVLIDDDGSLHFFEMGKFSAPTSYQLPDGVDQLWHSLREQVENASVGQLLHYAAWVDGYVNIE